MRDPIFHVVLQNLHKNVFHNHHFYSRPIKYFPLYDQKHRLLISTVVTVWCTIYQILSNHEKDGDQDVEVDDLIVLLHDVFHVISEHDYHILDSVEETNSTVLVPMLVKISAFPPLQCVGHIPLT